VAAKGGAARGEVIYYFKSVLSGSTRVILRNSAAT
jgi:hypothetical protein